MKNIILREGSSEKNLILFKSIETKKKLIKLFVVEKKIESVIKSSDVFLGGAVNNEQ